MSRFDPPSDPFGDEKHCRICDGDLVRDPWTKEWHCPTDHEEKQGLVKEYFDEFAANGKRLEIILATVTKNGGLIDKKSIEKILFMDAGLLNSELEKLTPKQNTVVSQDEEGNPNDDEGDK